MEAIDEEVTRLLHRASNRASEFLTEYRQQLEDVTQALLEREELSENELIEIIGPSVHPIPEPLNANVAEDDEGHDDSNTDASETNDISECDTDTSVNVDSKSLNLKPVSSDTSTDAAEVPSEQIAKTVESPNPDESDTAGPATT